MAPVAGFVMDAPAHGLANSFARPKSPALRLLLAARYQYICRLDVAMDDVLTVQILQTLGALSHPARIDDAGNGGCFFDLSGLSCMMAYSEPPSQYSITIYASQLVIFEP